MNIKSILRENKFIYSAGRSILSKYRNFKYGLKYVHKTFFIQADVDVSSDLCAGAYSYVGKNCSICPKVELGKYVMLAPRVTIVGGDHIFEDVGVPMIFAGRPDMPRTVIEDDVWVGINVTVMAGVRIRRGSIIAAGAVVTKDVDPYSIYGGVPARKIRDRFTSVEECEQHDQMLKSKLFDGEFCEPR